MARLTLSVVLLIVLAACTSQGDPGFVSARPSPISTVVPVGPGNVITVGSPFSGTFTGVAPTYTLTAPSNGTLVARLTWDPSLNGAKLMLTIGDHSFMSSAPDWSPLVARVAVSAGQTYAVKIEEGHAPWDYHFSDPFVLTATIE
jgi:hypothetical protein